MCIIAGRISLVSIDGQEILRLRLRMTITHRFVILNREAVKNLRPFLLRAGEDTRPYEKYGVPAKPASWGKGRMAVAADKFASNADLQIAAAILTL